MPKRCKKCGQEKDESEFYLRGPGNAYLSSPCRDCHSKSTKARRKSHGYKSKEDEYRRNNPDKVKRARLKNRYGITPEQVEDLYDSQHGRCAICGCQLGKYNIDHDHKTGKVRGLLCARCNKGLGFFDDCIEGLSRALSYLVNARDI